MQYKIRAGKRIYRISTDVILILLSVLVSAGIFAYGVAHYSDTPYFYTVVFASFLALSVPLGGYVYLKYIRIQNKEYFFPQFLKDLADGARAGLPLPEAVMNVSRINYGDLTEDVRKLATYISWGVPFDEAMHRFAERTGSKMIRSSVDLIVEAYMAGGNIADILDTMAEDAGKMHTLREERKTRFSGFISTLYAVYVVFLIIVVVLVTVLLPEIPTVPAVGETTLFGAKPSATGTIPENELSMIFMNLAVIEAIFAGLLAGIAGEGNIVAGIKHAFVLVVLGLAAFQIFIPVPDPVDRIGRAVVKLPPTIEATMVVGRYFIEDTMTVGEVLDAAEEYAKSMHIPYTAGVKRVIFAPDPAGCEPCAEGKIDIRPDAVVVNEPTYINVTVKTDPTTGVYYVYIS